MSFVAKLQRARDVLEQQGRLSVRALGRELGLVGDERALGLDELIEELVDVQGVAVREGNVLAWAPLGLPRRWRAQSSATTASRSSTHTATASPSSADDRAAGRVRPRPRTPS